MASRKKKAANSAENVIDAANAARENQYVKRFIEDADLRDELLSAYDAARNAYDRVSDKGPAKVLEDKKLQREVKQAAESLKAAADALRKPPKRKRRAGRVILLGIVGAGLAVALSEGLRKKVLDGLFGAEEEFEYTSSTTPSPANGATATSETVSA